MPAARAYYFDVMGDLWATLLDGRQPSDRQVALFTSAYPHVVIEFPDVETARRWYHSEEYQVALKIRQAKSTAKVMLVEGNRFWPRRRPHAGIGCDRPISEVCKVTESEEVFLSPPVSHVDPFCREFLENPFPAHEELREAGPVVWLSRDCVWAVARYDQVHAVLNDWQTFCSSRGVGITDFLRGKSWRPKSLVLETDPPLHDRTRRVLNRVLSPSVMSRLRERFAEEASGLVDELLGRGRFDGIVDLAEAYPLTVFPDAMGMPRENRHFLLPWGNMVFNSFGPRNEFFEEAVANAEPVLAWLQRQMQRDAFAPGGFGAAIHAATDTGELSQEEAPIVARSLLTAGVDTTVSGIGAAVYCLARFPEQFARLRADPSLARAAFEEAVRYESPVQTFFRTTTRRVDIAGIAVGEGERVLMFLGAANRDPRRWERPDEYDITRRTTGHVGFGSGIHQCVGQLLARLEGECVLSALARKAAAIEITSPPRRRYNNTLRALASLPVTLWPA